MIYFLHHIAVLFMTMHHPINVVLAQFGGGFNPSNAPFGGFGGGPCVANRTPAIFVHGNGENAADWFNPSSVDGISPIEHFQSAGYTMCELFGVTWLSTNEQENTAGNYHQETKAELVAGFIQDVKQFSGMDLVVIIGHSMGVTVSLHALDFTNRWSSVETFIGISGAMLGLTTCFSTGNANPDFPTCGSQNLFDSNIFGFYPGDDGILNTRMSSSSNGFVKQPLSQTKPRFYTIRAGASDEFVCPTHVDCTSSLFVNSTNVASQLDVGEGFPLIAPSGHDDTLGVGHFRSRTNTGTIQVNMAGGCSGLECCLGYNGNTCVD